MQGRCAITTYDNPWNPFTNFAEWFLFDVDHGYNTCDYLGRIAKTSGCMTDEENDEENESAIDEIIKFNPGIYKKVYESTPNGKIAAVKQ